MIEIDGSQGEGGGQVLRTSLALSIVTGAPFRIDGVRAGRRKPGLMRQHLTAVEAARSVCDGRVEGAALGSTRLEFTPGSVRGGAYEFAIGTAGSTTLVLQTVLPALATASERSSITLSGGTHNPFAPSVHFLQCAFLPLVSEMGPAVELRLERHGFYPAGGGRVHVTIEPADRWRPIERLEATPVRSRRAVATVAGLSESIAQRELAAFGARLGWPEDQLVVERVADGRGPGNVLGVELAREDVTEVFTGFGERGVSAEKVAEVTARDVGRYLAADVPVWRHLADQLMLPSALARGGAFRTGPLSPHATTNARVIESFLDVKIHTAEEGDDRTLVSILP